MSPKSELGAVVVPVACRGHLFGVLIFENPQDQTNVQIQLFTVCGIEVMQQR
jgi:hypothetical protein